MNVFKSFFIFAPDLIFSDSTIQICIFLFQYCIETSKEISSTTESILFWELISIFCKFQQSEIYKLNHSQKFAFQVLEQLHKIYPAISSFLSFQNFLSEKLPHNIFENFLIDIFDEANLKQFSLHT